MTALWIIVGCIAFMIAVASARGKPGRAIADTALLVILIGIITLVDMVLSQFMDTRGAGPVLAMIFAAAFALDALFGLLAPERQKRRDKQLRRLMKKRA